MDGESDAILFGLQLINRMIHYIVLSFIHILLHSYQMDL